MGAYGSPEHLDYIKYNSPLNKCSVCKLEYRGHICPQCGTSAYSQPYRAPRKAKMPIYKKGWFWAVLAVIVFFMGQPHEVSPVRTVPVQQNPNILQTPETQTPQAINETPAVITLAEYNQLQDGMSYSKVVGIIGSEGIIDSQSDAGDYHAIVYHWTGNDDYSEAYVEFENDELIYKVQIGLK